MKSDESEFIVWDDRYETGIEEIDRQHKYWINVINKFHKGLLLKWPPHTVIETILELEEYSKFHFKTEYDLFYETDYPEKESHLKSHNAFVKKLEEFHSRFEREGNDIKDDLSAFFKKWLIRHLLEQDKGYIKYVQGDVKSVLK